MKNLQLTEGVPHTHRRRTRHRCRIPVAYHHAVTIPLSCVVVDTTVSGIVFAAAVFALITFAFTILITGCLWYVVVSGWQLS